MIPCVLIISTLEQLQCGWKSDADQQYYWAHLLQVADANQTAVHNTGCATAEVIRNIFSATNVLPNVHNVLSSV